MLIILQMLQISTENLGWHWCNPLAIDNEGIITRTIETPENRATLVIRVKQISNCQKQVQYYTNDEEILKKYNRINICFRNLVLIILIC